MALEKLTYLRQPQCTDRSDHCQCPRSYVETTGKRTCVAQVQGSEYVPSDF